MAKALSGTEVCDLPLHVFHLLLGTRLSCSYKETPKHCVSNEVDVYGPLANGPVGDRGWRVPQHPQRAHVLL